MVWFKVDDGLLTHPKVLRLPRKDVLSCIGLWTLLGAWSAQHLTDGLIPFSIIKAWPRGTFYAERLSEVGLLSATEDGYQMHDWNDYQPVREQVLQRRAATRNRVSNWRSNHVTNAVSNDVGNDVSNGPPVPTRPVNGSSNELPIVSEMENRPDELPRDDVEKLVTTLADLMQQNGARAPTITTGWRRSARLLLDADGVTLDDALDVLVWSQRDGFWRANILSMPKFRAKFDQLRLSSQRGAGAESDADPWGNVPDWTNGDPNAVG
jgi:hypothetical protein